jgi:RNA polymerase sigma factor (sigma-70 family)
MQDSQRVPLSASFPSAALRAENAEASGETLAVKQRILQDVFDRQHNSLQNVLRSYIIKLDVAKGNEAQEMTLDLFSELYLVAMRTAEKFDASRSGLPWLLRIGYHLVLRKRDEQMRLRKHEAPIADFRNSQGDEESADADVFDRLAAFRHQEGTVTPLEAHHAASELLNLVNGEDRILLQLALVHGLSGEALARHLGIKPAAVRQRLHRAINRLKVAYANRFNISEARSG